MSDSFDEYISAKELKKNTDIIESSFTSAGLTLLSYGYQIDENSVNTMMEISSSNGKLNKDVQIISNLYDSDGDLISTSTAYVKHENFNGYDTIKTSDFFQELGIYAVKARIFVRKQN